MDRLITPAMTQAALESAVAKKQKETTMFDQKTLIELGAKVTEVSVTYTRKLSDGDYGSIGGVWGVTASVADDADPAVVHNALYEMCREQAEACLKPAVKALLRSRPTPQPPDHDEDEAPKRAAKKKVAKKLDGDIVREGDLVRFQIAGWSVETTRNGTKIAKIKGGKYMKFGVTCWPEILQEQGIDLDELDLGEYDEADLGATWAVCQPDPLKVVRLE